MSKLTRANEVTLAAFLIAFIWSLGMTMLSAPSSWATSIGVFESAQPNGLGEILNPSSNQPNPSSALKNLSGPKRGALNEIDAKLLENHSEAPELESSLADLSQIPDFTDSLTALEWVRQWADTGYWLESDQWADFQAIAIAGYSPEIQYWLGRDRWASFGAVPFGAGPNSIGAGIPTPRTGSATAYPTSASSIGGVADNPYRGVYSGTGGSRQSKTDGEAGPITLFDLAASMIKKVARQPAFYLIVLTGAGLLIWAFRKQAST